MEKNKKLSKNKCNNMRTVKAVRMESDHILEKLIGRGIMWEKGEKILLQMERASFVNGDFNDIVANIHVVTNKEADCSLGEGLVKQYLEAKKISFRTEHYIREIRKDMIFVGME